MSIHSVAASREWLSRISWQKSTFLAGAMIRRRSWINGLFITWFPPVLDAARLKSLAEAQRNGATARMGCNSCGPFSAPPRLCVRSDGSPRRRGRKFTLGKCAANFNRKAGGDIWGSIEIIRRGHVFASGRQLASEAPSSSAALPRGNVGNDFGQDAWLWRTITALALYSVRRYPSAFPVEYPNANGLFWTLPLDSVFPLMRP
ncbi:hypothetical protein I41_35260 [Lacipirellula limnantheis]|uniref:Uncharacterized protein n=1 Tax=Lacipirellula limnantheis TaxID=2528024 RepID=A0A517U134_9BACT|nr:hypothetical protein I41_35260 [Lacipirellula limnantheis]